MENERLKKYFNENPDKRLIIDKIIKRSDSINRERTLRWEKRKKEIEPWLKTFILQMGSRKI